MDPFRLLSKKLILGNMSRRGAPAKVLARCHKTPLRSAAQLRLFD
jgi:hypothetical protein